jgi:hypothetical protein
LDVSNILDDVALGCLGVGDAFKAVAAVVAHDEIEDGASKE